MRLHSPLILHVQKLINKTLGSLTLTEENKLEVTQTKINSHRKMVCHQNKRTDNL